MAESTKGTRMKELTELFKELLQEFRDIMREIYRNKIDALKAENKVLRKEMEKLQLKVEKMVNEEQENNTIINWLETRAEDPYELKQEIAEMIEAYLGLKTRIKSISNFLEECVK